MGLTRLTLCALGLLSTLASGCTSCEPAAPPPNPGDIGWRPTSVAYDPACETGCETVYEREVGHVGEVTVRANPDVDDAIAQWGDCLQSFISCMDAQNDVASCNASSDCPAGCRERVSQKIAGVADVNEQMELYETVFIAPGAPCRPARPEVTP
jgi:hypothetical protein